MTMEMGPAKSVQGVVMEPNDITQLVPRVILRSHLAQRAFDCRDQNPVQVNGVAHHRLHLVRVQAGYQTERDDLPSLFPLRPAMPPDELLDGSVVLHGPGGIARLRGRLLPDLVHLPADIAMGCEQAGRPRAEVFLPDAEPQLAHILPLVFGGLIQVILHPCHGFGGLPERLGALEDHREPADARGGPAVWPRSTPANLSTTAMAIWALWTALSASAICRRKPSSTSFSCLFRFVRMTSSCSGVPGLLRSVTAFNSATARSSSALLR